MTRDLDRFRSMLVDARRVVVFTGAGISTESGIPDFRSPGGIWSRTTPIMFDDFMASIEARRESWRRRIEIERDMVDARPNSGHAAVARLVATGKVTAVITQNIDGLHQASGVPEEKIIELHGNSTYATCLACDERHALDPILIAFRADGTIPQCRICGGIVKTATISFGQPMPVEAMERARTAALPVISSLPSGPPSWSGRRPPSRSWPSRTVRHSSFSIARPPTTTRMPTSSSTARLVRHCRRWSLLHETLSLRSGGGGVASPPGGLVLVVPVEENGAPRDRTRLARELGSVTPGEWFADERSCGKVRS